MDRKCKMLLKEINETLRKAIEKNTFEEIELAHSMFIVVENFEQERKNIQKERETVL